MIETQTAQAYLEHLNVFGIRLGLHRIERLLALLGNPERRYPTVHVTGTNGKGSASRMMATTLTAAGFRCGLYTSPHLVSYVERFQIDGCCISESEISRYLLRVKAVADTMNVEPPTQFEVLTAAAFLWFAEQGVDIAVIEVGLGGLLDSTNVITPRVAVITNVTFEHADKCGGTLEGVAHHKAGVIKDGVPVITAATGMPLAVIRQTAAEHRAPCYVLGDDFDARYEGHADSRQRLTFTREGQRLEYALSLLGASQRENSAVAIMALTLLGVNAATIAGTLPRVTWPGRFEVFTLAHGRRAVVDGAHNPAGAIDLRQSLDRYFPRERRVFLLGILADKDVEAMLATLLRPQDALIATMPDSPRASGPERLLNAAPCADKVAEAKPRAALTLALAQSQADGDALLIVAGSLYLIGGLRLLLKERAVYEQA